MKIHIFASCKTQPFSSQGITHRPLYHACAAWCLHVKLSFPSSHLDTHFDYILTQPTWSGNDWWCLLFDGLCSVKRQKCINVVLSCIHSGAAVLLLPCASQEILRCCFQRGSEACSSFSNALKMCWLSLSFEKPRKWENILRAHLFRPLYILTALWQLVAFSHLQTDIPTYICIHGQWHILIYSCSNCILHPIDRSLESCLIFWSESFLILWCLCCSSGLRAGFPFPFPLCLLLPSSFPLLWVLLP